MNKYLNLINPTAEDIKVLGRIVSVANDGVVASAYQIWDEYLHMWQGEINKKLYEYAIKHEGNIDYINDELENIYDQLENIKMGGIVDIIVNGVNMRNGSELVVDLGTIIRDVSNYYTKNETYNKEEIQDLVNRIPKMTIIKVDVLPEDPSQYVENIVLVPANPGEENNYYDEYIVSISESETPDEHGRLNYTWEKIGSTRIDLSGYATKEDWPDTLMELWDATQDVWNTWLASKNTPRSWVCLDNAGKIPTSLLPNLENLYIPLSQKGAVNGVASLDSYGKVLASQLDMPYRGTFSGNPHASDILPGIWSIDDMKIGPAVLNGENAHGILVQFPDRYKTSLFLIGRPNGSSNGNALEIYARRWLSTSNTWTNWLKISNVTPVTYSLSKSGNNIILNGSDGSTSQIADSNTTYTTMTAAQASAGTSTTGQLISAKVLNDLIENKLDGLNNTYWIKITKDGDQYNIDKPVSDVFLAREDKKVIIATYANTPGYDNYLFIPIPCRDEAGLIALYSLNYDWTNGIEFYIDIFTIDIDGNHEMDRLIISSNSDNLLKEVIFIETNQADYEGALSELPYCSSDTLNKLYLVYKNTDLTSPKQWWLFVTFHDSFNDSFEWVLIAGSEMQDGSYVHTDNNFSDELKNKLDGISEGAEVNVQSDWNLSNSSKDDYIKNKPTLSTVATSGDYNDLTNKPNIPDAVDLTGYATEGFVQSEVDNVLDDINSRGYISQIVGEIISASEWQPVNSIEDNILAVLKNAYILKIDEIGDGQRYTVAHKLYESETTNGSVVTSTVVFGALRFDTFQDKLRYLTYTITHNVLGTTYTYGSEDIQDLLV